MGQDRAKMGPRWAKMRPRWGPCWQLVCLCRARTAFSKNLRFGLGGSNVLGLRRGKIRPRWSYVGTKLAYVGPGLDLCWLMLAHVGCKVGLCWRKSGFRSLPDADPLSVLDPPALPPCAPSGPHVPPCAPINEIYIYTFVGSGGKKK